MTNHIKPLDQRQNELRQTLTVDRPAVKKQQRQRNKTMSERKDYPWHDTAIVMSANGSTNATIARTLKKAPSTIKRFMGTPKAKTRALEIFGGKSIEEIRKELADLAPLALLALKTLMESDDPNLMVPKADKALKILEAIGAKIPEESKVDHTHTHFDDFTKAIEDNARKQTGTA